MQKAEEVLSTANESPPDLVILDLLLSGHDGTSIARHLKKGEQTKAIPLLMISAYPNAARRTKDAGADVFLAKPFDILGLLTVVEALTEASG